MNLKHLTKDVGRFVAEQSPQILTILGVAGTVGTAYLASKAGFAASKKIADKKTMEAVHGEGHEWTTKEKVELTWKVYIPPVTAGVMTVACIVAANRVQARRFAAIAAAYGVLSGDFDEFRDKAAEKLGLKKMDEVESEIAAGKIKGALPTGGVLPDGKTWFYDQSARDIFPCTMETVKAAVNKVNYACNNQRSMTLNDFYEEMGREATSIGDILGWNSEHPCDVVFKPILTETHGAVTAFQFAKNPVPNF